VLRTAEAGGDGHGRAGGEFCYFIVHAVALLAGVARSTSAMLADRPTHRGQ
jgi:hypothetical protein